MGFILEVIGRFVAEIIFGVLFRTIIAFFRHVVFDGIYHAAMVYRFGLKYLRSVNSRYDATFKGRMGIAAFIIIAFFWVIIIAVIAFSLIVGIIWLFSNFI